MNLKRWLRVFILLLITAYGSLIQSTGCTGAAANIGGGTLALRINIVATGLSGTVSLYESGSGAYLLSQDGTYQISKNFEIGDHYSLTVTPPSGQSCVFSSATGIFSGMDITIYLYCSSTSYGVSGYVNGLESGSELKVSINGSEGESILGSGSFTLDSQIPAGAPISLSASAIGYVCSVSNGTSSSLAADLNQVQIGCLNSNMLFTAGEYSGNLGGREGADAKCSTSLTSQGFSSNCSHIAAFISVAADDEIRDLTTTYPFNTEKKIYESSGVKIGDNWSDILDGTIDNGITVSGTGYSVRGEWWSGSESDGRLSSENCSNWTSSSNAFEGIMGTDSLTSTNWINDFHFSCYVEADVLCLCMQDDFQLEGSVSGLNGTLILSLNSSESVTLVANSSFYFGTRLSSSASYSVAVTSQPSGQTCTLSHHTGTASSSMSAVTVTCSDGEGSGGAGGSSLSLIPPFVSNQGSIDMTASNVSLYRGTSTATQFKLPSAVLKGAGSSSVLSSADTDGDGTINTDENDAGTPVFIADSTASFGSSASYSGLSMGLNGNAVGDFDEDGDLDVVVIGHDGSPISALVYLNLGDGTFDTATPYTAGSNGINSSNVVVADFNNDHHFDLAVSNTTTSSEISILLGVGDGTFGAPSHVSVGAYSFGIVAGDFNEDGNIDLAVANQGATRNGTTFSVLMGNGSGGFATKVDYTTETGPSFITTADFNHDNHLDIALSNVGSNGDGTKISIFMGNGTGLFSSKTDYTTNAGPNGIVVGDFDGDDDVDIAVANTGTDNGTTVSIFTNNGMGSFGSTKTDITVVDAPYDIYAADIDGDGDVDLMASLLDGTIVPLVNNGSGVFAAGSGITGAAGGYEFFFTMADVDNNGTLDLLSANFAAGQLIRLLNH